jgi:glycosyltransferase involved in cell wall biosynthesis
LKVIYISDSLGTPIHPRGIYNYSVSLIEILKGLGASVDLVVEDAPGFGVGKQTSAFAPDSSPIVNSMRLSEIYRYFNEAHFHIKWPTRKKEWIISLARLTFVAAAARFLIKSIGPRRGRFVKNENSLVDFIPAKGEHLKYVDGFILRKRFYWGNVYRALFGLAPVAIDVSGYDLAIVDTPHFVNVMGIAPERVLTVFHDLIPLRSPTEGPKSRRLFLKKVLATLAQRGTFIFVSQYTQDQFHQGFPKYETRREVILHPSIRSSLTAGASQAVDGPTVGGAKCGTLTNEAFADLLAFKPADEEKQPLLEDGKKKIKRAKKKRAEDRALIERWDDNLPYFAAAVSDEPRKNIGILVEAFRSFRGRANIIIIGQIDARKHLGSGGRGAPNIVFTGYISDSAKLKILQGAAGVVFPSFAEGFGIPLVEGAVMGLPVLCSDIPVFRELARDDAIYFNPYDPKSLVNAIEETLSYPAIAQQKAELMRASVLERFSQDAMTRRLVTLLAEIGVEVAKSPHAATTSPLRVLHQPSVEPQG